MSKPMVSPTLRQPLQPISPLMQIFSAVWELLAVFRTLQLAIVLISGLAIGILIGVLMPQEGLVEVAQIKQQYGDSYRTLKALGLFSVYGSAWFITLQVLFFFNLLLGSFRWLKPAYLSATRPIFLGSKPIQAAANHFTLSSASTEANAYAQLKQALQKRGYTVKEQAQADSSTPALYASKGNFSRLGPVVAHFGILMFLIASVYGTFTGFKAQKIAAPGERFSLTQVNSFTPSIQQNLWLGSIPTHQISVKDFRIVFYPDHPETVKQYYCHLEVRSPEGQLLKDKIISVNDPLSIGDLTFYQASFAPTGRLFVKLNGVPVTLRINSQFGDRAISVLPLGRGMTLVLFPFFVQQDPGVRENHIRAFLRKDGRFMGAAPGKMPENIRLAEGQTRSLHGLQVTYVKPEMATGLQIKQAPEVPWIYLSYLIIIMGTLMCFFSQRQIWAATSLTSSGSQLLLLFKTNKAKVGFMKELQTIITQLEQQLPPHASAERIPV